MNTLLSLLPTFGHFLIGFYFVFFGIWNIYHWRPTIDIMLEDRIPSPIFFMSVGICIQVILGVMIMSNVLVKLSALLLIVFILCSVFIFHPFWKYSGEKKKNHMNKFIDNLTVTLGALVLLLNTITPISSLSDFLT